MKRLVTVAIVVLVVGVIVVLARSATRTTAAPNAAPTAAPGAGRVAGAEPSTTAANAMAAPASASSAAVGAAFNPPAPTAESIGAVKPITGNTNAQVATVAEALRMKEHPERLSTLIQPAPFDAPAYAANPQAYVDTVEPGRAFQSAQPGRDVPILMPVGRTRYTIDQDGQAILRVRTKPGAPATFTSFDLGKFGNGLVSQTVVADRNGVASVSFTAGPGTTDAVHILAASPVATEQVAFDVMVSPKKAAANGG